MNRQMSFHAMAEQELNDAASYYNALRPELGQAFLDEVERAVTQSLAYPEAAPLEPYCAEKASPSFPVQCHVLHTS